MAPQNSIEEAISSVRDVIFQVMDELMDEATMVERASSTTQHNTSSAEPVPAIAT
jgi:hypothetical protein